MSFIHDKQRRENHSQPTRNVLCSRACACGDLTLVLLVDSCLLPSVQGVGRNPDKVDRLDREEHGHCLKGWGCSTGDTRRYELAGPGGEACRGGMQEPWGCLHISTSNWKINVKTPFISFICRILNKSNPQEQRVERWLPGGSPGWWGEGSKCSAGRWVRPEGQV